MIMRSDSRGAAGLGGILAALLLLGFVYVILFGHDLLMNWRSSVWGLLVIALAYAVSAMLTGQFNPFALALGVDNRLSLSKAQTLWWTYIVLYAYVTLYAYDLRYLIQHPSPTTTAAVGTTSTSTVGGSSGKSINSTAAGGTAAGGTAAGGTAAGAPPIGTNALIAIQFPGSILLLLGFSVVSLIGAAGITSSQQTTGTTKKNILIKPDFSLKYLVQTDTGRVDLTRFQMLLWTLVASGIFVSDLQYMIATGQRQDWLPDVGSALVLLMGFGQATYLGGKLVTTAKPLAARLSAPTAKAGATLTLTGAGFGASKTATSAFQMQGVDIATTSWSDNQIQFDVPAKQPLNGQPWPSPGPTTVDLVVATGLVQSDAAQLDVNP
jgi:IPT/TIG domain-containing protein